MSIFNLERTEDADELGRLVRESDSAAVRGRAAEALGEVGGDDDVVETLVRTALEDANDGVRASAVDALASLDGPALERLLARKGGYDLEPGGSLPVEAYVEALEHGMPEMRMAGANAVGRAGVVEAVPALVRLLDEGNPRIRLRAVRAAGRLGDRRAVEPLLALTEDREARIRREVATALGETGGERALAGLLRLRGDADVDVRLAAVRALGSLADVRPVEPLIGCFEDEEDAVRRAAVRSLVELLSNAPPGGSHEMRTEIVEELSTTHGEVVTDALTELFDESTEAHKRRNAAWLLGRVTDGGPVAIETLVDALDDDDEMVRQFAATSLGEIDSPAVEEALLDALDTTFGEGRSMVLFALGTVGTEVARERLVALLDEVDDVETQEQTLAALSRLGGV